MNYYSLKNSNEIATFREATLLGQSPDGGLYFPCSIPKFSNSVLENLPSISRVDLAFAAIKPYVNEEIPSSTLKEIVAQTIDFDFPLVEVTPSVFALELYHGPTFAFKDVGARFMSRCLGYFVQNRKNPVKVLVATSGDTGGAVANGFYGVDGVEVIILYPSKKVSDVQELQLTTLGKNVTALEINGNFDDCQRLVKRAFSDKDLNRAHQLTSANSINVARWLPQQFYYLFAIQQWKDKKIPPVFSVPSGNFGNICAGLLAAKSGLPFSHFIAACNANQVITQYLINQEYKPRKVVPTISNAMDVGDPSNFVRILELFDQKFLNLKEVLSSFSFSDTQTAEAIRKVFINHKYLMDPHGAVAFLALEHWQGIHPATKGIFLETAHPIKFYDVVEPIIHQKIPVPDAIQALLLKRKISVKMEARFEDFKEYLLS